MPFTLIIAGGPLDGKVFPCAGPDGVTVGRQACDITLSHDPTCSSRHCRIEAGPAGFFLVDLGSKNGTHLNDAPITVAELHDGDIITAGETQLRFAAPSRCGEEGRSLPDIPGFTVLRRLGQEFTGAVYLARWGINGPTVLVKRPEREALPLVRRLQREAALLECCAHPHVVEFHSAGISSGRFVLATKYEAGASLREWVRQCGPRPVREAVGVVRQVLAALTTLHARGVVHRNVRPGGIRLSGQPARLHTRLGDFGLAGATQDNQPVPTGPNEELPEWFVSGPATRPGVRAGDPRFVSPEQAIDLHSVGPAGDQYAAAAVLYFLLTGQAPYDSRPQGEDGFKLVLEADPVPVRALRPDLPISLAAVLFQAMRRRPCDRFSDLAAFDAALVPFLN
jgi:serine/threonine protein kinase